MGDDLSNPAIDIFDPPLDPSIDDMQKVYEMEYDELLRSGLIDVIDQRDAARAIFDKGAMVLGEALGVIMAPPPTLADLLASFELEEEYAKKQGTILWQGVHDAAADAQANVTGANPVVAGQAGTDPGPVGSAATAAADAALGAVASASASIVDKLSVPKDCVHVSDSATIFKDWHIKTFPSTDWEAPYFLPVTDPTIVANIKKARSMVPAIPHGDQGTSKPQPAGVMAWVQFENGKTMQGWMYVEAKGAYQDYFWGRVHERYDAAKADADAKAADPALAVSPKRVMAARATQRAVSACHATFRQEGLCPAINTYDGTVLTWCSGLAAPGALNKIFVALNDDENSRKVMYLCGFLFTGNVMDGEFQIADVESDPPRVWHRSNFTTEDHVNPDTGKVIPELKKGCRDYSAFRVLEHFTRQLPLIYMLIALSRDELTRDKVFDPNFVAMMSMVTVAGAENIATEALYVFIGEVQHNWSLTSRRIATPLMKEKQQRPSNLVEWAIAHFTDDERELTLPSEEGDRAIAKGIFRFALRAIQEDALNIAKVELTVQLRKQKKTRLGDDDLLLSSRKTLYGFNRLMDNYWTPMQTGEGPAKFTPHSIDGSTLSIPDFPVKLGTGDAATQQAGPDAQVVQDSPASRTTTYYSIGNKDQCEFICPNDVSLLGFDASGNMIVKDAKTKVEYQLSRDGRTREWSRVS